MKLSDRTYRCSCGWICDRDINAALNIALYGAQEVLGVKSGQELAKVPSRNVLVEILSNRSRTSATQAKEAAAS